MNKTNIDFKSYWEKGITYPDYKAMIQDLHHNNKTTGNNHSEELLKYSRLNEHRSERIEKTFKALDSTLHTLKQLPFSLKWLIIAESWCGDVAQNIPAFYKLSELLKPKIEMRVVLRDENPELINAFLTNGGKAIPIVLCLNANFQYLHHWGPRPAPAQSIVLESKKNQIPYTEYGETLHKWYSKDKNVTLQNELTQLLQTAATLQHSL